MFCKKGALKTFAKRTEKTPVSESATWLATTWSALGLPHASNFIKTETPKETFSGEFRGIFKNCFFYRILTKAASACYILRNV